MTARLRSGPVIVGYDGSPASECALEEAAPVLAPRQALVVVVWEPGAAFDFVSTPPGLVPAPIDVRAALEVEEKLYEGARRLAEHGADLARCAGLEAEALAVADEVTPAATLVRLARERDGPAVVVGTPRLPRPHPRIARQYRGGGHAPGPLPRRGPRPGAQRSATYSFGADPSGVDVDYDRFAATVDQQTVSPAGGRARGRRPDHRSGLFPGALLVSAVPRGALTPSPHAVR